MEQEEIVEAQNTYLSSDRKGAPSPLRGVLAALLVVEVICGLLSGGTAGGGGTARAGGGPPTVHVGIVLDSSGSMAQNDPKGLSLLGP